MKYSLALFDMDGTVLDTLRDLADATNVTMQKHGFPTHSVETVRQLVGNGARVLIEKAVPAGTDFAKIDTVLQDFKEYYGKHSADTTKPYDGVIECLRTLRAAGICTAVVSNKPDFAVKALVAQYFPGLFDAIIGDRDNVRKKPAPDSVFEVMEALDITEEESVYIGDSDVDVQTAQNAGIDGIFVDWGFRSEACLREAGATVIARSVKELTALILNGQGG